VHFTIAWMSRRWKKLPCNFCRPITIFREESAGTNTDCFFSQDTTFLREKCFYYSLFAIQTDVKTTRPI
jgi:hypothetical protein